MEKKPKIIVILGQTATGKSNLAVKIAKKVNGLSQFRKLAGRTSQGEVLGEIISADSRQIYKGLDIGSGAITKKEMRNVPHHLLGIVSPKRKFTVAQFKKLADKKITEILKRNKVPIICGGTGFYIDAVVNNIILPEVKPNQKLRKQLVLKSAIALFSMLKKLDPARAKTIDQNNKVRLIRAIEIAKALGKVPPLRVRQDLAQKYEFIKIGLYAPDEFLEKNITKRIKKMFTQKTSGGLLNELKKLKKSGLSDKRIAELGFEYLYPLLFLQKKISKQEMLEKTILGNIKYSKRQMTWFKRDKEIKWFDVSRTNFNQSVLLLSFFE